MRKEFGMAVGGTYYGLAAYYTEKDVKKNHAVSSTNNVL